MESYMQEIIISSVMNQNMRTILESADSELDGNGRITDDAELRYAAERVCADRFELCGDFLQLAVSKGFSTPSIGEIVAPGSSAYRNLKRRLEESIRVLNRGKEPAEIDSFGLDDPALAAAPDSLRKMTIKSLLGALRSKRRETRLEAGRLLSEIEWPAGMIGSAVPALLKSIGRDHNPYDDGMTEIPELFAVIAGSELPVENKISVASSLAKLSGSRDIRISHEASLAMTLFAEGLTNAGEADRLAQFFLSRSRHRDRQARAGALGVLGIIVAMNESLSPEIKEHVLKVALSASQGPDAVTAAEGIVLLNRCIQANLDINSEERAFAVLRELLVNQSRQKRSAALRQMVLLAENVRNFPPLPVVGPTSIKDVLLKPVKEKISMDAADVLLDSLASSDDPHVRGEALIVLFRRADFLDQCSEEIITNIIFMLQSDNHVFRRVAFEVLNEIASREERALSARIKSALEKAAAYTAPEVLSVNRSKRGDVVHSREYFVGLGFSKVPDAATAIVPVTNGWEQRRVRLESNKVRVSIFMDERDPYAVSIIKFYDRAGKYIAETEEFHVSNPDCKPEYYD